MYTNNDHDLSGLALSQGIDQFITGFEGGEQTFSALVALALDIKANLPAYMAARPLAGKVLTSIFLNPSLRTRTSFEAAMAKLGGHMVTLTPGTGSWGLEFDPDAIMDADKAEHIIEAAGVLSSYSDAIGLRAFSAMEDFEAEMEDMPIKALAAHAKVPVVSLESACHHPCQALADAITLHELFDSKPQGERFVLSWAWHPKMCGVAVPHSALLTAARLGMDVTLAHPEGYDLHAPVVSMASELASSNGGGLKISHDMDEACKGAKVIYAKAWGSALDYGDKSAGAARNARHSDWTVGTKHMAMGQDPAFMHCLPVRRGVVVEGAVLDSPASAVQQQAANRLWGQMALLLKMIGGY
jgi:N-acetylornithine carbamoyltransferase